MFAHWKTAENPKDLDAGLVRYFKECQRIDLLTKAQEIQLFTEYDRLRKKALQCSGDQGALASIKADLTEIRNTIALANLRLVKAIAKSCLGGAAIPLAELVQQGNLYLFDAIEEFNLERKTKFSTFAVTKVGTALREYTVHSRSIVGHGRDMKQRMRNVEDMRAIFMDRHGYAPSNEELRAALGTTKDKLNTDLAALQAVSEYFLLSDPLSGSRLTLKDTLEAPSKSLDEDGIEGISTKIQKAMGCLTPKERDIVQRNVLDQDMRFTSLEEIGKAHGNKKARVALVRIEAFQKLHAVLKHDVEVLSLVL